MKIILPMAGYGTRMRPHTWSVPKPLVPLAGRTLIDHVLDRLLPLEPEEVICVVGYLGDQIERYLRANYDVPLRFVTQHEMRGQAHAIGLTKGLVSGPSLIMFVDTIFEADFSSLPELSADGVIFVKEIEDPRRFGIAILDAAGNATRLVEKPRQPESNLALVGIYYFKETERLYGAIDDVLANGPTLNGEYFLADAVQGLIDGGATLRAETIPVWEDCGKPEEHLRTNRYLLDQLDPPPCPRADSIVIRPSFVDPTATISRSVVGPYASIGAGASLEGVTIANSIVGEGASLRHVAVVDSIVGAEASLSRSASTVSLGASSEVTT